MAKITEEQLQKCLSYLNLTFEELISQSYRSETWKRVCQFLRYKPTLKNKKNFFQDFQRKRFRQKSECFSIATTNKGK